MTILQNVLYDHSSITLACPTEYVDAQFLSEVLVVFGDALMGSLSEEG